MDFRLAKPINDYLADRNLLGDGDIVSIAGATKNLDFVLGQIDTSIGLHGAKEIIICHHTDCGAYKEMQFSSFEKEREFQIGEMEKAKKAISDKYPDLKIKMLLAKIMPSGAVEIEKI